MNATNNLDSTQLEEQLKRLREDLKLSQEERGHLLLALERASEGRHQLAPLLPFGKILMKPDG